MCNRCAEQVAEPVQILGQIFAEMHAQSAPLPIGQYLKVSACLRGLHNAKRIFLLRNLQVVRLIAGDLQKYARVRTTLVSLSRAVQESGTEAKHRSYPL